LQYFTSRQPLSYSLLGTCERKHTKNIREFRRQVIHHRSGRFTPFVGGNFSGNTVARAI